MDNSSLLAASLRYSVEPRTSSLNATTDATLLDTADVEHVNSDYYKDFYLTAKNVTGLYIYPTVCLLGLAGNVIAVIVLCNSKLKTSTNVYLVALAFADGVKLLNDLLYFIATLIEKYDSHMGQETFHYLYPYAHFIMNSTSCLTAWYTIAVAVERYIYVCHPVSSKTICTIKRAKITCLLLCLTMSLIAVPSALRYNVFEVNNNGTGTGRSTILKVSPLWQNENFATCYTWVQNLLRGGIPLIVLIALNSRIIYSLRQSRANKKLRYRNRISMMLVSVIVVFLICITPDAILSTFFGYGYAEESFLVKGVREISDMLLAVNSAVNIVLYTIFNKLFRLHFMKLFCHETCLNNESQRELQSFEKVSDSMQTWSQKDLGTSSMLLLARCTDKGSLPVNNNVSHLQNGKNGYGKVLTCKLPPPDTRV